jgi:hypothetical protein
MKKLLILLLFATPTFAQAWSGQIAPIRATAWQSNGVGSALNSSSYIQCGTAIAAYSGTAGTITTAMGLCAPGTFVVLGSGTFNISTTINMVPMVVLRGGGANLTFIVFSNTQNSCGGESGDICFSDSTQDYFGSAAVAPGGTNSATWTGGYSRGSTSITLASVGSAGIANQQYIYLDQVNDNSTPSTGLIVCDNTTSPCSLEGGSPGRCSVGQGGSACVSPNIHRNQVQMVQVTAGCSPTCTGAGPFTLTITPGLYAANWRSGQSPGAWWGASNMQGAGIENLSMDHSGSTTFSGATFLNAFNCWETGVRDLNSVRNHVWLHQAAHITIANNYYFATQNGQEESYGVESFISSDNLIVNNIFQQVTTPIMMGPAEGSAIVYNFTINNLYALTTTFLFESIYGNHDAGNLYNLFEGNIGTGFEGDVFHGTGGLATLFRNYFVGWESTKSTNTVTFQPFSYNRFDNVLANVLGCKNTTTSYPGNCGNPYQTVYQAQNGPGASQQIYDIGAGNTEGSIVVAADPYVGTSLLRYGNCDAVNGFGNCQYNAAEVPTALTDGYANSVPATHTFPASYLYTAKPTFFPASKAWPLIGPDVTGGNIPGVSGLAYSNPAMDCYFANGGTQDGTGSALTYNLSLCGGSSPPPPPPVPSSPTIIGAASSQLPVNGTQQFTVQCNPASCSGISWKTTVGIITGTGLLTAPASASTGTVSVSGNGTTLSMPVTIFAVTASNPIKSFKASNTCPFTESFSVPQTRTITQTCQWNLNAAGTQYVASSCSCK